MIICGISDIHGNLYNKIPECDVLCICGDIVPLNIQRQNDASMKWFQLRFAEWVKDLPCKKVIVVPGNHDFYIEHEYLEGWNEFVEAYEIYTDGKVRFLIDELYTYENVTFYGTPWIQPIEFQEGRWAFEVPITKSSDSIYCNIPKCDILLTHDNPNYNKVLDYCSFGKYKHHLFGHWHSGISYGHLNQHNCSLLNDMYNFRKETNIVTINFDNMAAFNKKFIAEELFVRMITTSKLTQTTEFSEQLETFIKEYKDLFLEEAYSEEDEVEWKTDFSEEDISDIEAQSEALFLDIDALKEDIEQEP